MPEENFWEYKQRKGCTCPIKPGMTWFELRDLGTGCSPVGVCPVLDKARRSARQPTEAERTADDLALAVEYRTLAAQLKAAQ